MNETSKTNQVRGKAFRETYLTGKVLDIGCGIDIVCPDAQPFDMEHGDAQRILDYLSPQTFDSVHSSHCLEHMSDAKSALKQWWELVKPGGYMIIVVPDEDLYEQGYWPSRFNPDHKATFRLGGKTLFSPVSHDILQLVEQLPNAKILAAERQDQGYDHRLMAKGYTESQRKPLLPLRPLRRLLRALTKPIPRLRSSCTHWLEEYYFRNYAIPVDQTSRQALAQIQVIAQKSSA